MRNLDVLTTAQLAEELNVSFRTLHSLRKRGEGPPAVKLGRIYRYRRADVEEWLRTQALATTPPPAREEVSTAGCGHS